jgi:hypothetical protein
VVAARFNGDFCGPVTSDTSGTGGGCSDVGDTGSELGCKLSTRFSGGERVKEVISKE